MPTGQDDPNQRKKTPGSLGGFNEDQIEYWESLADSIGNPVPDYEDDSEFVDENGVVIKEFRPSTESEDRNSEDKKP